MQYRIDMDPGFYPRILFSDEATFNLSGKVSRHNARIWGTENPHIQREVVRDCPKANAWRGLIKDMLTGPCFFVKATVKVGVCLDTLEHLVYPK
jgi:hypothetical protein